MKKRFLSMVLVLCLTAALFAGMGPAASAASDKVTGYLVSYTVQAGDTIYGLCQRRGIDYASNYVMIGKINDLTNYALTVGKSIWLPSKTADTNAPYYTLIAHTLTKGETPSGVCKNYGIDYKASYNMLAGLNPDLTSLKAGQEIILPQYTDRDGNEDPTVKPTPSPGVPGEKVAYYLAPHQVQDGETVSGICSDMGASYKKVSKTVLAVNDMESAGDIRVGKLLLVPVTKVPVSGSYYRVMSHTVVAGDTIYDLCRTYGVDYNSYASMIQKLNDRKNLNLIHTGETFYIPVYVNRGASGGISLPEPKNVTVSTVANGISIRWKAVAGAAKYRVFYKPAGGSWTKAADTTATSYTWTGAKSGTKYQIRVWCVSWDGKTATSTYDAIKTVTYVAAPVYTVSCAADGVKISWKSVAGAAGYRVYCKTGSGSWKTLANTTATSYTWTGAETGTKYTFRVRCVNSAATAVTSFYNADQTFTFVAPPRLTAVVNTPNGIYVSWNKVTGAAKYRVFYKPAGGSWAKAGDTTSTNFTWTGAKKGTEYQIRVWCVSANGRTATSTYDTIETIVFAPTLLDAPQNVTASNAGTGIKVTWNKVTGAVKYRVFYKPAGGSWAKAGDTTATSFTWTGAKSGTAYQIRVRSISADGKTGTGDFSDSQSVLYIAAPKNVTVSGTSSGIKISWTKSVGAAKYRVYYKVGNGSWKTLTNTASTSYTWKGAKSGTTYTFRVRCVNSDATYVTSYYTADKTITYWK